MKNYLSKPQRRCVNSTVRHVTPGSIKMFSLVHRSLNGHGGRTRHCVHCGGWCRNHARLSSCRPLIHTHIFVIMWSWTPFVLQHRLYCYWRLLELFKIRLSTNPSEALFCLISDSLLRFNYEWSVYTHICLLSHFVKCYQGGVPLVWTCSPRSSSESLKETFGFDVHPRQSDDSRRTCPTGNGNPSSSRCDETAAQIFSLINK